MTSDGARLESRRTPHLHVRAACSADAPKTSAGATSASMSRPAEGGCGSNWRRPRRGPQGRQKQTKRERSPKPEELTGRHRVHPSEPKDKVWELIAPLLRPTPGDGGLALLAPQAQQEEGPMPPKLPKPPGRPRSRNAAPASAARAVKPPSPPMGPPVKRSVTSQYDRSEHIRRREQTAVQEQQTWDEETAKLKKPLTIAKGPPPPTGRRAPVPPGRTRAPRGRTRAPRGRARGRRAKPGAPTRHRRRASAGCARPTTPPARPRATRRGRRRPGGRSRA